MDATSMESNSRRHRVWSSDMNTDIRHNGRTDSKSVVPIVRMGY